MKPTSPCQFCEDREENGICHSYCEKYIAFTDENNARNEKIRKAKEQEGFKYYLSADEFRKTKKRSSNTFKQHKK